MKAVIDANIVLYSLLEHGPFTDARETLARVGTRIAPPTLELEVVGVLSKLAAAQLITVDEARRAYSDVGELEIELVDLDDLPLPAFEFALGIGLSAFDATYLALAMIEDAALATADSRLADIAEAMGAEVIRVA